MTLTCHVRFGERGRETRSSRGEKVRSAPTPFSLILSNIYLDKFDTYVEQVLIPGYTCGARRRPNLQYEALRAQAKRRKRAGKRKEAQ